MPRNARKKSSSGIYHIMLRGINRQQIFQDDEDYQRLLETFVKFQNICGYTIYAYCLMGNHIHLLLKEGKDDLGVVFKRIAGSFVYWYNRKYDRTGHLFQDRFKSEPVEEDSYFITVIRYIHQNPVKAGLCQRVEQYPHSSIHEYIREAKLVDTDFVFSMHPKEQFIQYQNELNTDDCLEMHTTSHITDKSAKEIIQKVTKCRTPSEFQSLEKNKQREYIHILHNKGLSIRCISRLTGISKKIVETSI